LIGSWEKYENGEVKRHPVAGVGCERIYPRGQFIRRREVWIRKRCWIVFW